MYIPVPYFKSVPYFGDMTLDYIFVKDNSPILFTCVAKNKIYLCLCFDNRREQKWAIAPINLETLRRLVFDEIPIRIALKPKDSLGCIVTWNPNDKREKYNMISCENFDDDDLPNDDLYLEDEDAITYYNIVKNRLEQIEMLDAERNVSIDSSQISLRLHMSFQSNLSNSSFSQNSYQSFSSNQTFHTTLSSLNFPHEDCRIPVASDRSNESKNSCEIMLAA